MFSKSNFWFDFGSKFGLVDFRDVRDILTGPSLMPFFLTDFISFKVISLSLVGSNISLSQNYFSDVNNWLNQVMVKWAWGWTLYSLLPFALLLAAASDDPKFNSTRAFVNVAVLGTIVWYVGTQITFRIGDLTGTCLDDNSSIIR